MLAHVHVSQVQHLLLDFSTLFPPQLFQGGHVQKLKKENDAFSEVVAYNPELVTLAKSVARGLSPYVLGPS